MESREIKFRCWDVANKKWLEQKAVYEELAEQGMWTPERNEYYKLHQYTGLKDKKGKEIFEGDILFVEERGEWDTDAKNNSYSVEWGGESDYPAFTLKGYEDLEYNSLQHAVTVACCEIIGNIYENPELIKK